MQSTTTHPDPDSGRRTPETFKHVVAARSRELGLTRNRLAKQVGVGRSTLYDWLAGTAAPSPQLWSALARELAMPLPDLLEAAGQSAQSIIRVRRLERGWTIAQLANEAGVSAASARRLELGERIRASAAVRVAVTLDLDPEVTRRLCSVLTPAATPLGKAIEAKRLAHGWTITDVARRLGVSRQMVSAWLAGQERVPDRRLSSMAELLEFPVAEVAALREQMQRP